VELEKSSAALNKFQSVFAAIVRMVATPSYYAGNTTQEIAPFGTVISESLSWLSTGVHSSGAEVNYDGYQKAVEKLMSDHGIDIDYKKMVKQYWETFLPEAPDKSITEQARGRFCSGLVVKAALGFIEKNTG
jgi:hypothetical protein